MNQKELLTFIKEKKGSAEVLLKDKSIEGVTCNLLHFEPNKTIYDHKSPRGSIFYLVSGEVLLSSENKLKTINEQVFFGIENIIESSDTYKAISVKASVVLELITDKSINITGGLTSIDNPIGKSTPKSIKPVSQFEGVQLRRDMNEDFSTVHHKAILIVFVNLVKATFNESKTFLDFLTSLIEKNELKIVIDLSMCTLIDSTFLGALVKSHKNIQQKRGEIVLVYDAQESSTLFMITHMDRVFKTCKSPEEAIIYFES